MSSERSRSRSRSPQSKKSQRSLLSKEDVRILEQGLKEYAKTSPDRWKYRWQQWVERLDLKNPSKIIELTDNRPYISIKSRIGNYDGYSRLEQLILFGGKYPHNSNEVIPVRGIVITSDGIVLDPSENTYHIKKLSKKLYVYFNTEDRDEIMW